MSAAGLSCVEAQRDRERRQPWASLHLPQGRPLVRVESPSGSPWRSWAWSQEGPPVAPAALPPTMVPAPTWLSHGPCAASRVPRAGFVPSFGLIFLAVCPEFLGSFKSCPALISLPRSRGVVPQSAHWGYARGMARAGRPPLLQPPAPQSSCAQSVV